MAEADLWDPADEDVLHLKLPNKLQFATIGKVLDQLEPMLRAGDEAKARRLLLDMSSTVFVSATGITVLAAAVEHLWNQDKFLSARLINPGSPLLWRYLVRMNFFAELNTSVAEDFERREPFGFRPVTHVPDEHESPAATRDLVAAVEDRHSIAGVLELEHRARA